MLQFSNRADFSKMLMLRASCSQLWMRFLIQLVCISSIVIVQTKSAENGDTTHPSEERSDIATVLKSNQGHNAIQPDTNERNSSLLCTQRFFHSNKSQEENDSAINSTSSYTQRRIKRCLQDLAKLNSKRLETLSKIKQQVEEWKTQRSARPSEARPFPKSVAKSHKRNDGPPMANQKKSYQGTKEVTNASMSSNNSLDIENKSTSSLTSNTSSDIEKYGNETFDKQNGMRKPTERMDEYPNKNQEESASKQPRPTQSSLTTSFENFDIVPVEIKTAAEFETSNIPPTTSGFSNLLTNSTSLTDTGDSTEIINSMTSTEPITEETTTPNIEEIHNSMKSNSSRPNMDFSNIYKKTLRILDSMDQPKPSNNTSDSQVKWLPQNFQLVSLNASEEIFLATTQNLDQDTSDNDIISSTSFSKIHQEIDVPKMSGGKTKHFLLPLTNDSIRENASLDYNLQENNSIPSSLFPNKNQNQSTIKIGVEGPFTKNEESSSKSFRYNSLKNLPQIGSLSSSTSLFLTTNEAVPGTSTTEDSFSIDGTANTSITHFAFPANSAGVGTNQNYLPSTTSMAELKPTKDDDIIFKSKNEGKTSFTSQLNAETSTEKFEKNQLDMKQLFMTVTGKSGDAMTLPTENYENIEKISDPMKSFESQVFKKITNQTEKYKQNQTSSIYSLPEKTFASFTNNRHNPEIQTSDSFATPTNFLLTPEAEQRENISIQVTGGSSKTENSVSTSTDSSHNFSEDHSPKLVKKSYKLPNENSKFSTPAMITDSPSHTPKKYKLKHFPHNSKENLSKRSHTGSMTSISENRRLHIHTTAPTDSPRGFDLPTGESYTDSSIEFSSENWASSRDSENTQGSVQEEDPPIIALFKNNSDSHFPDFVNVTKKTHKIQPGEVVPPMNPNENWKIGQNDTYYTIEELKAFLKMRKRSLAARMNPVEIVINLNGLNETTIIDFLKHNLTNAHQNDLISINTTKYTIFKVFSNSNDKFNKSGSNESGNSILIYSLIPQEDLFQRAGSSNASSDQKSITSKYLAQLEEYLFNATREDGNASKFFHELLGLNKTFSKPNLDLNTTNSNETVSNGTGILENKCSGNTEVILVNLKYPQPEKQLLEKLCSGCHKIVVFTDNATLLENAGYVTENKNFSFIKKLSIPAEKFLVNGKGVDDFEGETDVNKNGVGGKSARSPEKGVNAIEILSNRHHNSEPRSRDYFRTMTRDPDEQIIKKQFSFINPEVVDDFLDVYKRYSPRRSVRSKMRQLDHKYHARSNEDMQIPISHRSYRNEPPENVMENLLRELVRLRNSIPAAYVSHG